MSSAIAKLITGFPSRILSHIVQGVSRGCLSRTFPCAHCGCVRIRLSRCAAADIFLTLIDSTTLRITIFTWR